MLSRTSYDPGYVSACRRLFDTQLGAYRALVSGADPGAREAFERSFGRHLVVVLDAYFAHRARGQEKKDGNPLNEVRMLRDSILENGCVLAGNKSIKYRPEGAVLGLEIGSAIDLTEPDAARLAEAYFREIEEKFVNDAS